MNPQVLICGAGPTGMMLALRLVRSGVRVRVVDAAAEAGTTSRAIVVHARTLEFYRQMGLDRAFLDECLPFAAINLWVSGRRVARAEFAEIGTGLSPFPYAVVCPQDRHERFLENELLRHRVSIERSTRLIDLSQTADGVFAKLELPDGTHDVCDSAYLAGCDGSRSRVRDVLGIEFAGGTYSHRFYVADVEAIGPVMNHELHVALDDSDFIGIFPLQGGAAARLIGMVRDEDEADKDSLTWDCVGRLAAERMGVQVSRVNWFSTYRVHHRVAERFQVGRTFLLGDAAHVHSPVGAQGMNTGIGDAVNLAWKLADVLQGRAPAALLDSYEPERRAFARQLVGTTDRAFTLATSRGRLARFVRTKIVPRVVPAVFRLRSFRRRLFRTASQTQIAYRHSPVCRGQAGAVRGGDRLPWYADNYDELDGLTWQVHIYGELTESVRAACRSLVVSVRRFAWQPAMKSAGLTRSGLYLVRPDGHVALALVGENGDGLLQYAKEHFLRQSVLQEPF